MKEEISFKNIDVMKMSNTLGQLLFCDNLSLRKHTLQTANIGYVCGGGFSALPSLYISVIMYLNLILTDSQPETYPKIMFSGTHPYLTL